MKALVRDTFFITLGGLINRTKGLIFIPIIVGAIGFDGYGAFIQIFLIPKLVASLCTLELGMGFQRFASPLADDQKEGLSRHFFSICLPVLALALVGGLALLAAAPLLCDWFLEGRHLPSLRVASAVVLSNAAYGTLRGYMYSRRRFTRQSFFTLGYELCPYLGFVFALLAGGGLVAGVIVYAVLDALAAAALLGFCLRTVHWERPSWSITREYLRYSAPLSLSNLQGGLLSKADRFFVSGMMGLDAVGMYNVIYRCTELVGYISTPLRTQMQTYLSSAWDQGQVETSKAVLRTTLLTFFGITIGLLVCVALYFESLLPLLVGPTSVPHLSLIVLFIGTGVIADGFRRFYYLFIRLHKRTGHEFYYQLAGLVVNILLNLTLIPPLGLLGAAIATLVGYGILIPLIGLRYSLDLDLKFAGHLLSFGLLALVVVPLRLVVPDEGLAWILFSGGLGYLSYLALVVLLKRRFLAGVRTDLRAWQGLAL